MDANNIITILVGAAGVVGGFFGGQKLGSGTAVSTAVEVVSLLQAQVDTLEQALDRRDAEIADLTGRVNVLEEMVTQRAEVEAVRIEVVGVRSVVDRIADVVGA